MKKDFSCQICEPGAIAFGVPSDRSKYVSSEVTSDLDSGPHGCVCAGFTISRIALRPSIVCVYTVYGERGEAPVGSAPKCRKDCAFGVDRYCRGAVTAFPCASYCRKKNSSYWSACRPTSRFP